MKRRVVMIVAIMLLLTLALSACSTIGDAVTGAEASHCEEANAGRELYVSDEYGYCLQYPERYVVTELENGGIRIEDEPPAIPHPAPPFAHVQISDASGRKVQSIADEVAATLTGFEFKREDVELGDQIAVMFDPLPGQELGRGLLAVRDGKLYRLTFYSADETQPEYEEMLALYQTIVDSFSFLGDK